MKDQINNISKLKESRRALRNNPTEEEYLLWQKLKGRRLEGEKFRRQHSIDNFIIDFYCPNQKLAIEIDGHHHFTNEGKILDQDRDSCLENLGIRILHFTNREVTDRIDFVLEKIRKHLIK